MLAHLKSVPLVILSSKAGKEGISPCLNWRIWQPGQVRSPVGVRSAGQDFQGVRRGELSYGWRLIARVGGYLHITLCQLKFVL